MFINEDYTSYKYIVNTSDNYVILTNQRTVNGSWQNPEEIDIIYQYIKPSTLVIESTREYTTTTTFKEIEVKTDYWSRADSLEVTRTSLGILLLMLVMINGITRIFKKGGILFGN